MSAVLAVATIGVWRRNPDAATLDDVVELLSGIGTTLMGISATLKEIADFLADEDDGDA